MRGRPFGPEPVTSTGVPLLTHNHVMLLQALLDRPGGRVSSYAEWIQAALPYARMRHAPPSEWSLRRGIRTVNVAWVARNRQGSRITVALTARGRAILDGQMAAHVRGYGPYRGLATLRAARTPRRG